jgi:hypothetical protein
LLEIYVADLFQEIDEELRQDKASKLWSIYGKYIIAVVIIIIGLVAGYRFWQHDQIAKAEKASVIYESAMALGSSGDVRGAIKILSDPEVNEIPGYMALATMQKANLALKIKDIDGAMLTFQAIKNDDAVASVIRDLAHFNYILVRLKAKSETLEIRKLDELIQSDNPWRFMAKELRVSRALDNGNIALAKTLLSELTDDENTPDRLRGRMTELLKALP